MDNNDLLRRLRYALNVKDDYMEKCFTAGGNKITGQEIEALFLRDEESAFLVCSSRRMEQFLDGLIIMKRGVREDGSVPPPVARLTNNIILKKIRIALELREENMLEVFKLGEFPITKSELTALFRKEGHKNYKPCGDQLIKRFLKGLPLFSKEN